MKKRFRSEQRERGYMSSYEAAMGLWTIPHESCYVETKYGRTHVYMAGPEGAPPLVLFHGMGASSTMWFPNAEALANHFRIYAVDLMGDFGKSEPKEALAAKADCIEWIKELLELLRLENPYIAGHSMGGWMAAVFAAAYPERCGALVLLAPVATIAKVKLKFFLKMYPALLLRTRGGIAGLLQWCHAAGNRPHPLLLEQFVRGFQDGIFWLRAVPTVLGSDELAALPKTLVVIGKEEVIYDAEEAVRAAAASGLETRLILNASHCLTSEQTTLVNEAIIGFLLNNKRRSDEE